ncbi:MAG: ABC transporter permease, partial [Granulosicoccus sp.]|nr:ABC transporter permease [Granulosicoccus sp.]
MSRDSMPLLADESSVATAATRRLPRRSAFRVMGQVARKEMTLFLASPIAWLFFACFAALTLFIVFWGEAFFSRNIADVRPMFEWMPLLLILLCSSLTMRIWSEERRTGTLEHVLTQSTPLWSFAVGKYIACLGLLLVALLVVLPLPVTLSMISDIDWGPVWAGYLATVLLGSAYLSIGLFVSSRTQNQIVSLIGSVAVCGVFWLIGQRLITDNVGQNAGELLQALGTGSRFDAITRGVIDAGDLVYYLSLTLVFLALTVYGLERERWSQGERRVSHRRWQVATVLLVLNALALNLWMGQLDSWRLDTTRGKQYSLSATTRNYLAQLQQPLLLRGYFSAKTHPLLSPLVPQMRDLLREFEVAGDGRVRVEIIDPMENPELEEEANQQYGIEPVPFQVADRYQSSIVSSYFDVLVQYGDEYAVLGFRDLIDVKSRGETDIDVQLRNPEYDLTKSIRRVLTDFQSAGDVFASIDTPVELTAYVSSTEQLPAELARYRSEIEAAASAMAEQSGGKLQVSFVDPEAGGGEIAAQLTRDYGLRPMNAGLFSSKLFWFHILLVGDGQAVQLPLDDLSTAGFEANLDAGLKRFAEGFTRTIALVGVAPSPQMPGMQQGMPASEFRTLEDFLRTEYDVVQEDLADGRVSKNADLLLLAAPTSLDERALFAVDQFLMQGGTVITATSPWTASLSRSRLDIAAVESGLGEWLSHNGINIKQSLVMDPRNAAFPAPVTRNVGGMQLQEMRMLDYPWFIDVRDEGISDRSPVGAGLDQVTMAWASPIRIDDATGERDTLTLLSSSAGSWLSTSTDVMPRLSEDGGALSTWQAEGETGNHALAVSSTGSFDSFFA